MRKLTGLFLGAGASYEAGMPLVWELTAELKGTLLPDRVREENGRARARGLGFHEAVVEDFLNVLQNDTMHYEAVLGYLEAQFIRKREFTQDYRAAYSWIVSCVYGMLYNRLINQKSYLERFLPFYDGTARLAAANTPLWIFSLNHDVIVEAIAARLKLPLYYGFDPSNVIILPRRDPHGCKIGELRAEVLTHDELQNSAMHFPNPGRPGIYLLKLHGALDQFVFNDGSDLLRLLPDTQDVDGLTGALQAANEELIYPLPGAPDGIANAMNEIAYADQDGVMQFLRRSLLAGAHKFDTRHRQVLPTGMLKHFEGNINFVSRLVVIGYSFGDNHINKVLCNWLEFSEDRSMHIVDVAEGGVPPFLLHLSPQVTRERATATEFLDREAGIERSPNELLERRLAAVTRKLGKKARDLTESFLREDRDRAVATLVTKLKGLPILDGQPDFSSLGEPEMVAQEWASAADLDNDVALRRMVDYLEKAVPA
ncbi:hypothetical protein [Sphingomonas sp.]|uniref:hypothetical protein n=1 Tax=Sphingomonas sp. TaxID=28214 RepID=UPI0025EDFD1E|nr:hypothetical protein [Sphingomonas sp.]